MLTWGACLPACLPSLAILGVYFGPFHALGRLGCY